MNLVLREMNLCKYYKIKEKFISFTKHISAILHSLSILRKLYYLKKKRKTCLVFNLSYPKKEFP